MTDHGSNDALEELQRRAADEEPPLQGEYIPKAEAAEQQPSKVEILAAMYKLAADLLAPAWEIQQSECLVLAGAHVPLFDKYFGSFDLGVELTAVMATAMVFGPRIGKPHKPDPAPAPPDAAP